MPNRLPVPEELLHLIEKRDVDSVDGGERRSGTERRQVDLGPLGAIESATDLDEIPVEERRSGDERRKAPDRRKQR
ncbi:MAG: hypothetical protein GXX96_16295 [Planctomycetaceae bacterium]|nr:hypothetical protein [Planctomycetaceae bacterium]